MNGSFARMGFLLADKPAGPTSHDVVAIAKRSLGAKVGHAGTLDPFATGLLVLGVGRATRLLEYVSGLDKEYEATAVLGVGTDTGDPQGAVVSEDDHWRTLDEDRISTVAKSLAGKLLQKPPRYSAVKVQGVPAHRRTRRGEDVRLSPRTVTIRSLDVLAAELPRVRFRTVCSSGTYIRSLTAELGARLGTSCHLTALRRTKIGDFDARNAAPLEDLRRASSLDRYWLEPSVALGHLARVCVDPEQAALLAAGRKVPVTASLPSSRVTAFVLPDGDLVAVGAVGGGLLTPKKVMLRG